MKTLVSACHDQVWQVRIPLPYPLQWVNAYLIRDREGVTLVDPGLHTEEALEAWQEALHQLGIADLNAIRQIVLTHHHPDHFGLAGWFQARSGAPVLMSPEAWKQAQLLWGDGQPASPRILRQFRMHGMDKPMLDKMAAHLQSFVPRVTPFPTTVTLLSPGQTICFGGTAWLALHTPGHAYGHLSLYDSAERRLFCGDHVLPRITPNIGLDLGLDDNPLASYLQSLSEMKKREVSLAFPGHREPFTDYRSRLSALEQHHDERLARIRHELKTPMTVYALCRRLFGERLSVHNLRFAMAETLAHVVYLERQDEIRRIGDSEPVLYGLRV